MRLLPLLTLASALAGVAAGAPARVAVQVMPRIVMAGGALRVTCRVPRDARNRGLTIGVALYTTHFVQMDGEAAAVTNTWVFDHVPCDVGDTFCRLTDDTEKVYEARLPVTVAGCGSSEKR